MPDTKVTTDKRFTFDCDDTVHVVEFCQLEFLTDYLAIGTTTRLIVVRCTVKEEKANITDIEFEQIAEFQHGVRVVDISWSPLTDLLSIPRCLALFTAGDDKKIRCLKSDTKGDTIVIPVGDHKDHVNAVASCPSNGDQVASVSDDHTCCIWSAAEPGINLACFPLTSPGMAVCWHAKESGKIMVAEKKGVIRMYSAMKLQAFMSLDCGHAPLLSADWSSLNELRVAAVAGTDCFVFNTSQSSWPLEVMTAAHAEGGYIIRWSRLHDHLLATCGRPGSQLKVFSVRTNQNVMTVDTKIANGLCWHTRFPLIAVGCDTQVLMFPVDTI